MFYILSPKKKHTHTTLEAQEKRNKIKEQPIDVVYENRCFITLKRREQWEIHIV